MIARSADRHRLAATVVVAIAALAAACVSAGPATATIPTSGTVIEAVDVDDDGTVFGTDELFIDAGFQEIKGGLLAVEEDIFHRRDLDRDSLDLGVLGGIQ